MNALKQISRTIIDEIEEGEIQEKDDVEQRKKQLCRETSFEGMPKNSDILKFAEDDEKKARKVLKRPSR